VASRGRQSGTAQLTAQVQQLRAGSQPNDGGERAGARVGEGGEDARLAGGRKLTLLCGGQGDAVAADGLAIQGRLNPVAGM